MTNNLKAERTIPAENRVSDKRLAQMIDDANLQYLAAGYPDFCAIWQDRIDAFTELQFLRSQSLSTQQPMGEPVAWAREVDINGPCLILPCFLRWADVAMFKSQRGNKDAVFRPLYALHPNQESGE